MRLRVYALVSFAGRNKTRSQASFTSLLPSNSHPHDTHTQDAGVDCGTDLEREWVSMSAGSKRSSSGSGAGGGGGGMGGRRGKL